MDRQMGQECTSRYELPWYECTSTMTKPLAWYDAYGSATRTYSYISVAREW